MARSLILASGSQIRAEMLANAGINFESIQPRVDEEMLKAALAQEGASPRDTADALAEAKARKIGAKHAEALVLGCDQVLAFENAIFSKPDSPEHARQQLTTLSGARHMLLSACVIYYQGEPLWRHVGQVRLHMRTLSESYIDTYVARNWESIKYSVGGYKLEEEGVRLFSRIDGDYFTILGMPLIEVINYLTLSGDLEG